MVLAGLAGVVGCSLWTNRLQEFRGTLKSHLTDVKPAVLGAVHWPARLITATGNSGLDLRRLSDWRQLVEAWDGRQVIVHGISRTKLRRFWPVQRFIEVIDLRLLGDSTLAALEKQRPWTAFSVKACGRPKPPAAGARLNRHLNCRSLKAW